MMAYLVAGVALTSDVGFWLIFLLRYFPIREILSLLGKLERMDGMLEEVLGYTFTNKELLNLALTHPSSLSPQTPNELRPLLSNQRLEFFGDAILGFITAAFFMQMYPQATEGQLTQARANFVRGKSLGMVGEILGLRQYLITSPYHTVSENDLSDTVEALIAAIYEDSNILKAEEFIYRLFDIYQANGLDRVEVKENPKNIFQRLAAKKFRGVEPTYVVQQTSDKQFQCLLYLDQTLVSQGFGPNKKTAEVNAAEAGCNYLANKQLVG